MTRRPAALLAFASLLLTAPAALACPQPSSEVLFHSCWGQASVALALLPEDLPLPPAPPEGKRITVTGAYTATDKRAGDLAKPVGLFVDAGKVINPNLGRMDGVLVIDAATGWPQLHHRARLVHRSRFYNLTDLTQRRAFLRAAAANGSSVMQSHLLIVDGRIDVAETEDAPMATRRLLFTDAEGFGLYQTAGPVTLRFAAERIAADVGPKMALNLDMGSYDFCALVEKGVESNCGLVDAAGMAKLSNLLAFSLR